MIRTPRPTGRPSLVGGPRSDWSPRWPQPPGGRSRLMGEVQPQALPPPNWPAPPSTVPDPTAPGFSNPQPPPNWAVPPSPVPNPAAPGFANPQPLPNAEVGAPFQGAPVNPRLVGNRFRRPPTMGVPIPAAPAPMVPAPVPAPAVNPWTNIFKQRFR